MDLNWVLLALACIGGIYMAWTIGANDVANTMGTSVGSHSLSVRQAIILAAVFEFLGAFLVGDQVTHTIKTGIVDPVDFLSKPLEFAVGMTAALLAAGIWLQFASVRGLPVSTTHSIIGSLIGFGVMLAGIDAVRWNKLLEIFAGWCVAPIVGATFAFAMFFVVRRYILDVMNPIEAIKRWVPFLLFLVMGAMSFITLQAANDKLKFVADEAHLALIALGIGAFSVLVSLPFVLRLHDKADRDLNLLQVEKIFAWLQVITACFMALAHGSNDVANAVGPVAAVIATLREGTVTTTQAVPLWLLAMGGVFIVVGLATYGRRVMETVGSKITEITPTRGFSAEFAAAFTILVASYWGIPLSTTQVLVGAVIGVGLARGIAGLNMVVIRRIVGSWGITIPVTAVASSVFCLAAVYLVRLF